MLFTYNTLIYGVIKGGHLAEAMRLKDKMVATSLVTGLWI